MDINQSNQTNFDPPIVQSANTNRRHQIISRLIYSIGGLILAAGVILLLVQFWHDLPAAVKILTTGGLGLLLFVITVFLEATSQTAPRSLKEILILIALPLVIIGTVVTAGELFNQSFAAEWQVVTAVVIAGMAGGLFLIRRGAVYLLIIIAAITWLFYALVALPIWQDIDTAILPTGSLFAYLTLILSLIYLSLTKPLINLSIDNRSERLAAVIYTAAALGLPGSVLALSALYQSEILSILALVAIIALFGLALYWRRSGIAAASTLILISHIIYVLEEALVYLIFWLWLPLIIFIGLLIAWLKFRRQSSVELYWLMIILAVSWLPYSILLLEPVVSVLEAAARTPQAFFLYLTSLIGLSYLGLGYIFSNQLAYSRLSSLLNFVGAIMLVSPLFSLSVIYIGVWDLLAAIIILGLLTFGAYRDQKSIFVPASLLLLILVFLVSTRYFADTVGWPLALILIGLTFIGLGWFYYLKFVNQSPPIDGAF